MTNELNNKVHNDKKKVQKQNYIKSKFDFLSKTLLLKNCIRASNLEALKFYNFLSSLLGRLV